MGIKNDAMMHSNRLKQKLHAQFPNICTQHKRCDVLLAFNEEACELDRDLEAAHLPRAA